VGSYRTVYFDVIQRIHGEIADTDTLLAGNIAPQSGRLTIGGSPTQKDVYVENGHDFQVWGVGAELRTDGGADLKVGGGGSFTVPAFGAHRFYGGTLSVEIPFSIDATTTLINGQTITTSNNGDITLDPHGTGIVNIDNNFYATGYDLGDPANRAGTLYADALDAGSISGPNIYLPSTTSVPEGIIFVDSKRFLHSYWVNNLFLGSDSGNLTLTGSGNTAIGKETLKATTTAANNTVVGYRAGYQITVGDANTALGHEALYSNDNGHDNVAIGYRSFYSSVASRDCIAIGNSALELHTGGDQNIAIGTDSLQNNLTGSKNTVVGYQAGINATGSENVFIGWRAGQNEVGSNKLYISNNTVNPPLIYGDFTSSELTINADLLQTSAEPFVINYDANGATGEVAGHVVAAGDGTGNVEAFRTRLIGPTSTLWLEHKTNPTDVADLNEIGYTQFFGLNPAGLYVDIKTDVLVTGLDIGTSLNRGANIYFNRFDLPITISSTVGVLSFDTTPALHIYGTNNTFLGLNSGNFTLTGGANVGVGENSLVALTNGYSNVAVGYNAMSGSNSTAETVAIGEETCSVTTGTTRNTAVGWHALRDGASSSSTAVGHKALEAASGGSNNTALGRSASVNLISGSNNVSVGVRAHYGATAGDNNVAVGSSALGDLGVGLTGSQNVCIGNSTGLSLTGAASGNVMLGHNAGQNELGSNKLYIANSSTATPLIGGDFSIPRLDINGDIYATSTLVDLQTNVTTLDVPSGTGFSIGGVALTTPNFTSSNVDTLLDGSNADGLHYHEELKINGLDTSAMVQYQAGYVSADNTISPTDCSAATGSFKSATFVGVYNAVIGEVVNSGKVEVQFDAALVPAPVAGDPAILSWVNPGQFRNDVPIKNSNNFQTKAGIILDASNYGGNQRCVIIIDPDVPVRV